MKKLILFSLLLCFAKLNAQICFRPPQGFPSGTANASAIRNADFDNNGIPDMIVVKDTASNGGRIVVYMNYNAGTQSFSTTTTYVLPSNTGPTDVAVADFDADGKQDVVYTNYSSANYLSVLPGNGDGTFAATPITFNVGSYPESMTIADFNGDTKPDIAVVNNGSNFISILGNTSAGASAFTFTTNTVNVGNGYTQIIAANFDAANGMDFAAMNSAGSIISFLNNGSGGFVPTSTLTLSNNANGITVGDYNGDNKPDIAAVGSYNNNVYVFINTGAGGTFNTAVTFNAGISASLLEGITTADFDLDGKLDIAVIGYGGSNGLFVLPGIGNGSFNPAASFTFAANNSASSLIRGDYNMDGIQDLAFAIGGTNPANIMINAKPVISGTTVLCSGASTILTANGAGTYNWSSNAGSATTNTVSLTPSTTTTYSVVGLTGGCSAPSAITVTVNLLPSITAVVSPTAICAGNTATLTASGANTYTWNTSATTASTTAAPGTSSTYTVTGTNAVGCVASTTVSLIVNPNPVAAAVSNGPVCMGQTLNFTNTSTGATTYSWTGPNAFSSTLANPSIPSVSLSAAGNYTLVAGNAAGCSNTAIMGVGVNTLPNVTISGTNTICAGSATTLTASGPSSTYTWSTTETTNTISVSPGANTTYTVTGRLSGTGCTNTATSTVIVNAIPVITSVASPSVICAGASSTLTASGAVTYTWTPNTNLNNAIGASVVATPTGSINYTAVGTDANGCVSDQFASGLTNVQVNPIPVITVTATTNPTCTGMCNGQAAINIGGGVGGPLSILPVNWTLSGYAATGTGLCGGTQSVTVTAGNGCATTQTISIVDPTVISAVTSGTATSCGLINGITASTNVMGGTAPYTFAWLPTGGTTNNTANSSSYSNLAPGTYTLTISDNNGCSKGVSATVNASSNTASVSISPAAPTVCIGSSLALTASGNVTTYTWSTGANTFVENVSPSTNTSYTVSGTDVNGCINMSLTTVTVNPLPTVTVNSATICTGNSTTLNATGANTYTWNTGANTTTITVSPTTNTTYTVTGTDANGCINFTTSGITVNSLPTITATATPSAICIGASTTLTATGTATSYSWSTGFVGTTITDFPVTNTAYTVTGTDANNCVNTATTTVTVNSNPGLSINSASICLGQQTATLTVSSGTAISYSWSPSTGLSATSGSVVTGNPTTTTDYTVIGTDINNCSTSTTTTITVNSLPVVTVNSATICPAYAATLTANGASNYSWSTSENTQSINVNPTTTTAYTVTGTDLNFCTNTAIANVTVNLFDDLSGTIYDTTTVSGIHPITLGGNVMLYPVQSMSTAIDTANLLASGISANINNTNGSYSFSQVASGSYYLKAVADTHFYHGAIPTYLSTRPNAYRWDSAAVVIHTGCNGGNDAGHDITIIELPALTGTGIISGTITATPTFGQRMANGGHNQPMGAPIKGIDVKLGRNPGGSCAAMTTADTNGVYQFTGVDTGSYNIYVDIPNFGMVTILTVSITPTNSVSVDNNYCVDSTNIGLCQQTTNVKQVAGNIYKVSVYPNPNNGLVNLQMDDYENARIEIYSIIGQKVLTQQMQNNLQQVNITSLADGVYQIRVLKNNNTVFQTKIIKQ